MPAFTVTINAEANRRLVESAFREHRRLYQQAGYMLERLLLDGEAATPERVVRTGFDDTRRSNAQGGRVVIQLDAEDAERLTQRAARERRSLREQALADLREALSSENRTKP